MEICNAFPEPNMSSKYGFQCLIGNSQMLGNHSSGQHFSERSHDRTLTPQGVNGNSTGQVPQVFDGGKSSAFPWPVEDNEQELFNTSGMCLTRFFLILLK